MRIGILGTGDVGKALGEGFVARGHHVTIGSRDAGGGKAADWAKKHGAKAAAGDFAAAAKAGELIVLATAWSGTKPALDLAGGAAAFAGKVVIDATNPLEFPPGQPPRLALGHTDSGGEQVQRWLPGAKVVKAFNTVGHAHMVSPSFAGGPPDMPIAGDDAAAKKAVVGILGAFGWGAYDLGGIAAARYLEPLAMAWIVYGISTGTWNHAFKLLRK